MMKHSIFFIIINILILPDLISQNILWEVNDATSWENIKEEGTNLTISSDGLTVPSNASNDYSFKSKIIEFDRLVDARDIVFKQSAVWDNWQSAGNVQPNGASDAPVLVSVGDGNYYYLARGSSGGYHAWHSSNMQTWTERGPVTPPGIGRWVTSAEMINGSFYIYADDLNDATPRLFIDDNLDDGIPGRDMGHVFVKETGGSDCAIFRDDEDGLVHLIYEDWSPINARENSWDSPLAGHTSSPDGINGFTANKHRPAVDLRTTPTGQFDTYLHPQIGTLSYEIHTPAQDAFGDWTSIKVGGRYYLFGDYDLHGGGIQIGRFSSESIYDEYDLVGSLGGGHPDPTVGFAEEQFYLITQQNIDYVSPGPWVDGVTARAGVDTDGDGTIDNWTSWQTIKETYDHKNGYIRVVETQDAKINLSALPSGFGFQFEFRVDNSVVVNVSPLMDKVSMSFSGAAPIGDNLALNQPSSQSSTDFGGVSSRAVDGNTNSKWSSNSITHTTRVSSLDPWWRVDLGESKSIENISIHNRSDGNFENRLKKAKVYIGNINSTNPNDYTEVGTLNNNIIQHIGSINTSGRYVMIRIAGEGILSLAEVQVYGKEQSFIPDPNKTYYLDVPQHNLRLAATGQSQDAYTTSTNTIGADVEWRFVDKGNGFWHIRRAAGGALPGLRTDNTANADMQSTSSAGVYTYYRFDHGNTSGTHYITLPDGPTNFQRLQMNPQGDILFTSTGAGGNWVSWKITEAPQATFYQNCLYTGNRISLGIGEYSNIADEGLSINNLSSLRIPEGLQVTLFWGFNFSGGSITLTADDNCLINNSFNDITNSLIIEPVALGTRALQRNLSVTPIFGQKSKLQWYFSQEDTKKVKQYLIKHSSSSEEEMQEISILPAEDSDGLVTYDYVHQFPNMGNNYYQVVIQYEDGTENYQLVGDISFQEKVGLVQISPNPTDGNLFIDLSRYMDKSVYYFVNSTTGKQVLEGTWDGSHDDTVELDLENIQNGLYVLYVKPDKERATALKFVVSKDY